MTDQRRQLLQQENAEQHRTAYANLSPEQRTLRQEQDAEQHRTAYANLSPEQRTLRQEQVAQQNRTAYANLSPEQRALRQQNTQRRRILRNEQPPLYRAATVPITNEDSLFLNTLLEQEIIYAPIVVLYDGHLKVLEELYVAQMGRMEI